jgi:hypothetical protein
MKKNNLPKGYSYQLCPPMLYIDVSNIHGIGVFAKEALNKGLILGKTHLMHEDKCLRLDFGGMINHSNNQNCKIVKLDNSGFYYLRTVKDIYPAEEITVDYGHSVCGLKQNQ